MADRQRLRGAIAEALGAVRRGDEDGALAMFDRLACSSWHTLRDTILELAGANFDMLLAMTDSHREENLVITLSDGEGELRSVDDLAPAQRTATRVLLALASGHEDDAKTQLEIAADAEDPDVAGEVLAHTVTWTLDMVDSCTATGKDIPTWLNPVLLGGEG
jgi:hypothetical protein